MRDTVCDAQQNRSLIDHWQAHLSSVRIFFTRAGIPNVLDQER
jgi:hypothetical protein